MGVGSGLRFCGHPDALCWPGTERQRAEGGRSRTACSKACRLAGQKCQVCAGTKEGTGNLLKINLYFFIRKMGGMATQTGKAQGKAYRMYCVT